MNETYTDTLKGYKSGDTYQVKDYLYGGSCLNIFKYDSVLPDHPSYTPKLVETWKTDERNKQNEIIDNRNIRPFSVIDFKNGVVSCDITVPVVSAFISVDFNIVMETDHVGCNSNIWFSYDGTSGTKTMDEDFDFTEAMVADYSRFCYLGYDENTPFAHSKYWNELLRYSLRLDTLPIHPVYSEISYLVPKNKYLTEWYDFDWDEYNLIDPLVTLKLGDTNTKLNVRLEQRRMNLVLPQIDGVKYKVVPIGSTFGGLYDVVQDTDENGSLFRRFRYAKAIPYMQKFYDEPFESGTLVVGYGQIFSVTAIFDQNAGTVTSWTCDRNGISVQQGPEYAPGTYNIIVTCTWERGDATLTPVYNEFTPIVSFMCDAFGSSIPLTVNGNDTPWSKTFQSHIGDKYDLYAEVNEDEYRDIFWEIVNLGDPNTVETQHSKSACFEVQSQTQVVCILHAEKRGPTYVQVNIDDDNVGYVEVFAHTEYGDHTFTDNGQFSVPYGTWVQFYVRGLKNNPFKLNADTDIVIEECFGKMELYNESGNTIYARVYAAYEGIGTFSVQASNKSGFKIVPVGEDNVLGYNVTVHTDNSSGRMRASISPNTKTYVEVGEDISIPYTENPLTVVVDLVTTPQWDDDHITHLMDWSQYTSSNNERHVLILNNIPYMDYNPKSLSIYMDGASENCDIGSLCLDDVGTCTITLENIIDAPYQTSLSVGDGGYVQYSQSGKGYTTHNVKPYGKYALKAQTNEGKWEQLKTLFFSWVNSRNHLVQEPPVIIGAEGKMVDESDFSISQELSVDWRDPEAVSNGVLVIPALWSTMNTTVNVKLVDYTTGSTYNFGLYEFMQFIGTTDDIVTVKIDGDNVSAQNVKTRFSTIESNDGSYNVFGQTIDISVLQTEITSPAGVDGGWVLRFENISEEIWNNESQYSCGDPTTETEYHHHVHTDQKYIDLEGQHSEMRINILFTRNSI